MAEESKKESNPNMALWDKVEKTDPSKTKNVTIGARKYTAIDATYQNKIATRAFGKYGDTWGLKKSDFLWNILDKTGLVIHQAVFFYTVDGKTSEFPIHNAIEVYKIKKNNAGEEYLKTDEDFAKKVETNTVSKALSKLGFSADVFMGKFEDHNYVNEQKLAHDLEQVDENPEVLIAKRKEFFEWCEKEIKSYELLTNTTSVQAVYNQHTKKASAKCDLLNVPYNDKDGKEGIGSKFAKAKNEALARLKNKS